MSAPSLEVFDKTLNTTNIWLDEIGTSIGPDRQVAWKVLSVVLHKLRDRLPVELAAHLGAELPLLVRGAYFDQFEPERHPENWDRDGFLSEVSDWLSDTRPVNPEDAVRAVFTVLSAHVPHGQISKVQHALPENLQAIWQAAEAKPIRLPDESGRAP